MRSTPALRIVATVLALSPAGAMAQNVQRQSYVMSDAMHQELDSRQFDSNTIERIVIGISDALASRDLGPILESAAAEIRVTDTASNRLVKKQDLAAYKSRLFADAAQTAGVSDESRFILRSESIGINGGEFWISEDCLDDKCDQKKTHIITINLP